MSEQVVEVHEEVEVNEEEEANEQAAPSYEERALRAILAAVSPDLDIEAEIDRVGVNRKGDIQYSAPPATTENTPKRKPATRRSPAVKSEAQEKKERLAEARALIHNYQNRMGQTPYEYH